MMTGGLVGLSLAATVAWAWAKFGRQVNLSRFFNVTAIFMLAFAAMLALRAFYEFTEIALIPGLDNSYWHGVTEAYVEGEYAQIVSLLLVLMPSLWLGVTYVLDRKKTELA
jgi:high-affinity iron transporter